MWNVFLLLFVGGNIQGDGDFCGGPQEMGKSIRTESACSGVWTRLNVFNSPLKLLLL